MLSEGTGYQKKWENSRINKNLTQLSHVYWPRCSRSLRQESDRWGLSLSIHQKNVLVKNCASAVILPLIKTLHHTSEAHSGPDNEPFSETKTGIMNTKIQESVEGHPNILRKDVLRLLSFSNAERGYIESTTSMQWKCEEWYIQKAGVTTASKCERVFTRARCHQKKEKDFKTLVDILCHPSHNTVVVKIRKWKSFRGGLFHEESACRAYQRVDSHTHHKLELVSQGFIISKIKPFFSVSVDNIQKCQCSNGCPNKVLEYKYSWKQRDMHPKEAFLTLVSFLLIQASWLKCVPSLRCFGLNRFSLYDE